MSRPRLALGLVLGLAVLAASPAFAAIRCGTQLVSEGDTRSEVAAKCGEPTEIVTEKSVFRRPVIWSGGRPYYIGEDSIEIQVEAFGGQVLEPSGMQVQEPEREAGVAFRLGEREPVGRPRPLGDLHELEAIGGESHGQPHRAQIHGPGEAQRDAPA